MTILGISGKDVRTVSVLLSGALLVVLNLMLVSNALPAIMVDMQVDGTTIQWLTSAYALTEAVMIPLSAWFMGRVPTRKLFIGCMTLFAAGIFVDAIAPSFGLLLIGRILQASATGVLMTTVMALILVIFPREMRGQAMGLVGLIIGFAPAVGPTVGGLLVDLVGWRMLFVIVLVFAVLIIIGAFAAMQNYDAFPRTKFDVLSVIFSSIGLASLLYGISTFASTDNYLMVGAFMFVGVIGIALFVHRQSLLEEPMLELSVLKSRRYRTAVIVVGIIQAALVGCGVLMPLYVQGVLQYSATVSGLTVLPGAVAGGITSLFAGRVYDRIGVRKIAVIGALSLFAGGCMMLFFSTTSSLGLVIAANFVMFTCEQLLMTPINTWGINSLSNDVVQHATATSNTINQVCGSFGTALLMSFSAVGMALSPGLNGIELLCAGYHVSFIASVVLLGVMTFIILFFVRDMKGERAITNTSAPALVVDDPQRSVVAVMETTPITIPSSATVGEAADMLAGTNISGAPVVTADGTLAGFLSNSDILRMLGRDADAVSGILSGYTVVQAFGDAQLRTHLAHLLDVNVMKIATKKVVTITPDVSFDVACNILANRRIKELPVVDDGKLVGIVHRRSLIAAISKMLEIERQAQSEQESLD